MHRPGRTTVLLSGGIDSTVVLALLRTELAPDVQALFVDYGQPAAAAEGSASRALAARLHVPWGRVVAGPLPTPGPGEVPGRNDLLVAVAFAATSATAVAVGVHAGTGYADCSPGWHERWNAHLDGQYDGARHLLAPLLHRTKGEVLALAEALGLPLRLTHSCERADAACGTCASCLDRRHLDQDRHPDLAALEDRPC